jgi:HEAT repeat protein
VRFLSKLLNIRSNEWPLFLFFYLMLFISYSGLLWGFIIVQAAFLQQVGVEALPLFFIIKAMASIPVVALYTAFADRISNEKLLVAIAAVALAFIGLGLLLISWQMVAIAFPLLYLLIFVPLDDIYYTHWYTSVNSYYDTRAAKRIIPVLATAGSIAGIFAGLTIPLLNNWLTASGIITIWAGTLVLVIVMVGAMPYLFKKQTAGDSTPAPASGSTHSSLSYRANIQEGYRYIAQSTFLKWLAVSTLIVMTLLTVLEYRTGQILLQELGSVQEMANFFGLLTSVANIIFLPIQLLLLSRIISRIGLGNANLIFPIGAALGSMGLIFAPGRFTAALAFIVRIDFYGTFGYLINSLLYNAVPLRVKGRARAFIGGLVVPLGGLLGGLLLLWPVLANTQFLSFLIAGLVVALIGAALVIRQQYGQALITMLEEEDFSSLFAQEASDLTVTDPQTVNWLKKKFEENTNPELTIFMAKLLSQVGGREAVPILGQTARTAEAAHIRSAILDVLVATETTGSEVFNLYTHFLTDPSPDVRLSAIAGLEQLSGPKDKQFIELMQSVLHDDDPNVQGRVLSALVRSHDFYTLTSAVAVLSELLGSDDATRRVHGVQILGQLADKQAIIHLVDYLCDPVDEVRLEAALAVEALSAHKFPQHTEQLVQEPLRTLVHDPVERIRQGALVALGRIGGVDAPRTLAQALSDSSHEVRSTAIETLLRLGKVVIPTVHPLLDSPDAQMRKMATVLLARINPREFGALVTSHITGNLIHIYRNHIQAEALTPCAKHPSIAILQSALREQSQALADEVFYLLTALHNPDSINILIQSFRSEDGRTRANATEALEALTTPQTARLIEPLFEPQLSLVKMLDIAREVWSMEKPKTADLIRQMATETDISPWFKTIVTFALGEIGVTVWNGLTAVATASDPAAVAPMIDEKPSRPRPRRTSADLFNSLMQDSKPEQPAPPAGRPRRPNPLDLLGESEGDKKPATEVESEQKEEQGPDITETRLSDFSFTAADVRRLSPKASGNQAGEVACEALFAPAEIEKLLAAALLFPNREVQKAAQAANRVMAGIGIADSAVKEEIVLSIIEKIIFLKEVPFFQGMTIDQLKVLASVCEEEFFANEKRIFSQDEPGGVLYVVVSGRVGIEQEKRKGSFARLATLGPHTYFGEMNLFDNSPHTASAITLQDTLTLRLRREPLIALARQYPGLSLELINVLSARLRETSDRIAELTKTRPRELHKLFDQYE